MSYIPTEQVERYMRAGYPVKLVMMTLYGLKLRLTRYGGHYAQHYAELRDNDKLDYQTLQAVQLAKLKELLTDAWQYSKHYRSLMDDVGMDLAEIQGANSPSELLEQLPYISKSALNDNITEISLKHPERPVYGEARTSGTSGKPLSVLEDKSTVEYGFAEWRRFYDWMGLPKSFRSVRLSGRKVVELTRERPPFWMPVLPLRQLFMSVYHLSDENLRLYVNKLNRYQPHLIDGYPSAVYVLAKYILENGLELTFRPTAIACTAETLYDYQRRIIEKAFDCRLHNQYASSEGAPWIAECKCGGLHLWLDTGVFEFVNTVDIDDDTTMAEVVVTSFRARKTPIIRYRIGDYVLLHKHHVKCPCGCEMPLVKSIIGRESDIMYTRQKGYILFTTGAIGDLQRRGLVKERQFVQLDPESLEVNIVRGDGYTEATEQEFLSLIRQRFGEEIRVGFNYVDEIAPGPNGKVKKNERRFELPGL